METKRHLHIVSQTQASIGEVTQDIIEGLKEFFVITQESLGERPEITDTLLCHYFTPGLVSHRNFNNFRYKILIFPIDGTEFTKEFQDYFNKFDLIITPANAGKRILEQNGVTVPVKVIPNFWKKEHLKRPGSLRLKNLNKEIKDSYVFYYEANYYPRKGYQELMVNYVRTFSSDVVKPDTVLLIKTDNTLKTHEYFEEVKDEIFGLQSKYKYPAKILKISQHVSFDDLKKIWDKIDCYIHPARIEGFGIPLLRMSVLGKPIIVLENEYSGYNDYLNNYPYCFKVKSNEQVASNESNKAYSQNSKWCIGDPKSFKETMSFVKTYFSKYVQNSFSYKQNLEEYQREVKKYEFENVIQEYKNIINSLPRDNKFSEHVPVSGVKYICSKGHSGYAEAAKDYITGLHNAKIPVTVEFIEETYDKTNISIDEKDIFINSLVNKKINYNKVIIHSTPEFWLKYKKREKELSSSCEIIGMTVWEADRLDERWPNWINQMDKVIVPCTFNIEVFKNSGVTIPIETIPHICKPIIPVSRKIKEKEGYYTFYSIGQWTERKGTEDLIKAFLNTYTSKDKVCLLLKTFGFNYSDHEKEIVKNKVNSLMDKYPDPAKIVLVLNECTEEEIRVIHYSGDCFLSLCKSEGWGLGAFDAITYGKPVIITGWGGQMDFIKQPSVNYTLVSVGKMEWCPWHNEKQLWAQPDLEHAQFLMKQMSENKMLDINKIVVQQTSKVREKYTDKVITEKLISFLSTT